MGGAQGERFFAEDEFAQKVRHALEDEAEPVPNCYNDLPIMRQLYKRGGNRMIGPILIGPIASTWLSTVAKCNNDCGLRTHGTSMASK